MTYTSAGTILPENQATNAWRATDTPRHGQDDGSFRDSGPARKDPGSAKLVRGRPSVSPSPGERDFHKGRWPDVAIRKTAASCSLVAPPAEWPQDRLIRRHRQGTA